MRHAVRVAADFCRHRIGHRGAFLLFLVVLDLLYGIAALTEKPGDSIAFLTWHEWGIAWIAVGLFILSGVFSRYDVSQFTVAITFKAFWTTAIAVATMHHRLQGGWLNVILWFAVMLLIFLISSWPEPPPKRRDGG